MERATVVDKLLGTTILSHPSEEGTDDEHNQSLDLFIMADPSLQLIQIPHEHSEGDGKRVGARGGDCGEGQSRALNSSLLRVIQ